RMWAEAGLTDIDQRSLMIRMDFTDFADYWGPFASGEGALGAYVANLDDARRKRLERQLRSAYLTGRPDGERSFVAVALSCRGVVRDQPPLGRDRHWPEPVKPVKQREQGQAVKRDVEREGEIDQRQSAQPIIPGEEPTIAPAVAEPAR